MDLVSECFKCLMLKGKQSKNSISVYLLKAAASRPQQEVLLGETSKKYIQFLKF